MPCLQKRITPAGAGKTLILPTRSCAEKDHPRRCGENLKTESLALCTSGSPPQVRGKHAIVNFDEPIFGITPAGAGKTVCFQPCCAAILDHPRRCGENQDVSATSRKTAGSPPQVRGKPITKNGLAYGQRITPAGAGKTQTRTDMAAQRGDHPRRCGENRVAFRDFGDETGSPPQVRGKHLVCLLHSRETRITPAGAGKTCFIAEVQAEVTDHPRRCGENAVTGFNREECMGSPPQVRGKLFYRRP